MTPKHFGVSIFQILHERYQFPERLAKFAGQRLSFQQKRSNRYETLIATHAFIVPFLPGYIDPHRMHGCQNIRFDYVCKIAKNQRERRASDCHIPEK